MTVKTVFIVLVLVLCSSAAASAQRKSVGGAEVTGTFNKYFAGKFKGSSSEIKIRALGKGKIRIAFDLVYPFVDGSGEMSANLGQLQGEADINGDTAVYSGDEFGPCKITIKFLRPGTIRVTQEDGNCGFGHNVTADGTYKKTNGKKPSFEDRL
jgi:hypothetical protein